MDQSGLFDSCVGPTSLECLSIQDSLTIRLDMTKNLALPEFLSASKQKIDQVVVILRHGYTG